MITIRCTKCEKTARVATEPHDPPGAVSANILCPECVCGDFDSPQYFDADGRELRAGD